MGIHNENAPTTKLTCDHCKKKETLIVWDMHKTWRHYSYEDNKFIVLCGDCNKDYSTFIREVLYCFGNKSAEIPIDIIFFKKYADGLQRCMCCNQKIYCPHCNFQSTLCLNCKENDGY